MGTHNIWSDYMTTLATEHWDHYMSEGVEASVLTWKLFIKLTFSKGFYATMYSVQFGEQLGEWPFLHSSLWP